MLRYIFVAIEKRHKVTELKKVVNDTNIDLGKFLRDGNFEKWLELHVSCALR